MGNRLHVSLRPGHKKRLDAFATSQGLSTSALIRGVIERMPEIYDESEADSQIVRTTKITIRLTPHEVKEIDRLSQEAGMHRATWLASLARANLQSEPMFTDKELLAVHEAARQLAHIGSNLNQMARALNIDALQAERPTMVFLRDLAAQVEALKKQVYGLARASDRHWSI